MQQFYLKRRRKKIKKKLKEKCGKFLNIHRQDICVRADMCCLAFEWMTTFVAVELFDLVFCSFFLLSLLSEN